MNDYMYIEDGTDVGSSTGPHTKYGLFFVSSSSPSSTDSDKSIAVTVNG
jgi:hypothetical protein